MLPVCPNVSFKDAALTLGRCIGATSAASEWNLRECSVHLKAVCGTAK